MCKKRGHFNVELVVSMRPIRRDLIQRVFEISQPLTNAHGAPVHIGNPGKIKVSVCFWFCGKYTTGSLATFDLEKTAEMLQIH